MTALRDFSTAAAFGIPNLLPVLAEIGPERWSDVLHDVYEGNRANREAGDAIEARSQTFEAATSALRIHWMPASGAPAGDVTIPGPIPDTVEVLALDAGTSIRHLSERLFATWGVPLDDVVRVARERVLELPLARFDWAERGSPAVHGISLEDEGPYVGALLAGLEHVESGAVGPFGTVLGVPVRNALVYRSLDWEQGLREDLAQLAVFTATFAEEQQHDGFLPMPIWRRPDGRSSIVTFQFAADHTIADSHDPGFAGVLAVLDPRELLPVPGWAQGVLGDQAYTRFAGCVSATSGIHPTEVALVGSAYSLPALALQCRAESLDEWPALVGTHLDAIAADADAANRIARSAGVDPAAAREHLVTWLDAPEALTTDGVARPIGTTGLVEILGVHASDHAVPMSVDAAAAAGETDELMALGREAVRRALVVETQAIAFLSGDARRVTADPSPTAAVPHLQAWLPDIVGSHGALVSVGSADHLLVLPIRDASAVLDVPRLLGLAVGSTVHAPWAIPPTVFWLAPDRLETLRAVVTDGVYTGVTMTADLTDLVARLPAEPAQLPPGLEPILGPDGARRFYGLLHAEVVERLGSHAADLVELTAIGLRGFALACQGLPPVEWQAVIGRHLDEASAPRRELDRLTLTSDYADVAPALRIGVARHELAGSNLAIDVGGGIAAYPRLSVEGRYRRVTHPMLARWDVTSERCHADAAANTAGDPHLVDEPMYPDNVSARQLYARTVELEAAGLFLHLRHPGTRRGFVVSITHGSRAHYLRLDDPGAGAMIPVFARVIAGMYEEADKAADAHSPWLLWLTPDGRTIELFDTREPVPPANRLPPAFVAMLEGRPLLRPN